MRPIRASPPPRTLLRSLPGSCRRPVINYFLDLWPGTRLISTVLLALNTFLLLYDFRMYLSLLSRLLVKPAPIANRKLRIVARIGGFVVPAAVIVPFLFSFRS